MNSETNNESSKKPEREIVTDFQPHIPHGVPHRRLKNAIEYAAEKAARYNSPGETAENVMLGVLGKTADFHTIFDDSFTAFDANYPVSPAWQRILDYLYGEGVISSPRVVIEYPFNDEPKIFSLRLFTNFDEKTDGFSNIQRGHSRGVDRNFERAISKVIGEFLERYPLTIYRRKNLLRGSMNALRRANKRHLDLNDLALFSEWQYELFPQRKFNANTEFHWIETKELTTGSKAYIPAQLVFWNYNLTQEPVEPALRQPNTNGSGGQFTYEEAVLSGIYETIQRDAFLIHWLNSNTPSRIDTDSIEDPELRAFLDDFKRYNIEVTLLNTTSEFEIPVIIAVIIDKSGSEYRMGVGGGCSPSVKTAIFQSLTEALGVYHWLRTNNHRYELTADYKPFQDFSLDQERRLLLWGKGDMFPKIEPFLQGEKEDFIDRPGIFKEPFLSPKEELAALLDLFRKRGRGYEIYVYEAKHALLEILGYHSVQVIIPAMIPLYLSEVLAPLGARRLSEIPSKLGFSVAKDVNPWPHPFP